MWFIVWTAIVVGEKSIWKSILSETVFYSIYSFSPLSLLDCSLKVLRQISLKSCLVPEWLHYTIIFLLKIFQLYTSNIKNELNINFEMVMVNSPHKSCSICAVNFLFWDMGTSAVNLSAGSATSVDLLQHHHRVAEDEINSALLLYVL